MTRPAVVSRASRVLRRMGIFSGGPVVSRSRSHPLAGSATNIRSTAVPAQVPKVPSLGGLGRRVDRTQVGRPPAIPPDLKDQGPDGSGSTALLVGARRLRG